MEYYRMKEGEGGGNLLHPQFPLTTTELWAKTEPIFLPGEARYPKEELLFLPFYEGRAMLISSKLKKIFQKYQKGGRYRPCAFGSIEQRELKPYYLMLPRVMDALHEDTRYYRNGEIEEMVLDKEKTGSHRVFGITSIRRIRLLVGEDVLEEILRAGITGFNWEKIRTR